MKQKFLAITLASSLIFSGVTAFAEDIDLSSYTLVQLVELENKLDTMTLDQLIELNNKISTMIAEMGGTNVIGEGTYEAGVDIAAGYYSIVCSQNNNYGFLNVFTYPTREDYDRRNDDDYEDNHEVSQIYFNDEDPDSSEHVIIKLEEGNILDLSGEGIIEAISKPSWALG